MLTKPWQDHGWRENGELLLCNKDKILPPMLVNALDEQYEELEASPAPNGV